MLVDGRGCTPVPTSVTVSLASCPQTRPKHRSRILDAICAGDEFGASSLDYVTVSLGSTIIDTRLQD